MEYELSHGFTTPTSTRQLLHTRLQAISEYMNNCSCYECFQTIQELAGPLVDRSTGKVLWPLRVKSAINKHHFKCADRITWAAFCYLNSVPFSYMVYYAHSRKVLKDDQAYMDLMNSWCPNKIPTLESMTNLYTYDRFMQTIS